MTHATTVCRFWRPDRAHIPGTALAGALLFRALADAEVKAAVDFIFITVNTTRNTP
jgi:hypothetical protein